jgi:hypothetical protein
VKRAKLRKRKGGAGQARMSAQPARGIAHVHPGWLMLQMATQRGCNFRYVLNDFALRAGNPAQARRRPDDIRIRWFIPTAALGTTRLQGAPLPLMEVFRDTIMSNHPTKLSLPRVELVGGAIRWTSHSTSAHPPAAGVCRYKPDLKTGHRKSLDPCVYIK